MKFLQKASLFSILHLTLRLCLVVHGAPAPLPPARAATHAFVGEHPNTDAACLSIHNTRSSDDTAYFRAVESTDAQPRRTTVQDQIIFKCEDTTPANRRIEPSVSGPFVMACAIGFEAQTRQATVNGRATQKGYCVFGLNGSGQVIRAGNTDCTDFDEAQLRNNLRQRYSAASRFEAWATASINSIPHELISQALSITEITSGHDTNSPTVFVSAKNDDYVRLPNIKFKPGSILRVCATARQGLGNLVLHIGLGTV